MVLQDRGELAIIGTARALVVPVGRFELFLDRHDGAVYVDDVTPQPILGFVESLTRAGHAAVLPATRGRETSGCRCVQQVLGAFTPARRACIHSSTSFSAASFSS